MTLLEAADQSMRRVLKATWAGTALAGADYYCLDLECGHGAHVSEPALRSPLLCLHCVKALLADSIPKLEDWPAPAPMPSSLPTEPEPTPATRGPDTQDAPLPDESPEEAGAP